jgi:hypothetical protein
MPDRVAQRSADIRGVHQQEARQAQRVRVIEEGKAAAGLSEHNVREQRKRELSISSRESTIISAPDPSQ